MVEEITTREHKGGGSTKIFFSFFLQTLYGYPERESRHYRLDLKLVYNRVKLQNTFR